MATSTALNEKTNEFGQYFNLGLPGVGVKRGLPRFNPGGVVTPADPVGVGAKNYFRGKDPAGVGVEKKIRGHDPAGVGVKNIFRGHDPVGVGVKNIFRGHDPAGVGVGKKNRGRDPACSGAKNRGRGRGLAGVDPGDPGFCEYPGSNRKPGSTPRS